MKRNEHGGDIYSRRVDYDFSANLNPLGIPEEVKQAAASADFERYPDPLCRRLTKALSEREGIPETRIVCGNGAAELIYRIVNAVKPRTALLCAPTFGEYEKALAERDCRMEKHDLSEKIGFALDDGIVQKITAETNLLFLCSPNNPVGNTIARETLRRISEKCLQTGTLLVLDECFLDFVKNGRALSAVPLLHEKMIVLKAFTKSYAMAGLRLGYALFGSSTLAEKVKESGQPWSVSAPAQAAGLAALKIPDYPRRAQELIGREREFLMEKLRALGIRAYPSEANFLLFRCERPLDRLLAEKYIAVRSCENYDGLGAGFFRIAVRPHEENEILIKAIKEILNA